MEHTEGTVFEPVVHQNPVAIGRCSKSSNFREGFWSRRQIEGVPNRTNRMGILEYGYTHSEAGRKRRTTRLRSHCVAMMQATESRNRSTRTSAWWRASNRPACWRILSEPQMRAILMVVA